MGVTFKIAASCQICWAISSPRKWTSLHAATDARLAFSGNILAIYLLAGPVIQCMGICHAVSTSQQLVEYAILDGTLKVFGCHMLTKRRELGTSRIVQPPPSPEWSNQLAPAHA